MDDATDKLNALLDQISAQKGKKITDTGADELIDCVESLIAALI